MPLCSASDAAHEGVSPLNDQLTSDLRDRPATRFNVPGREFSPEMAYTFLTRLEKGRVSDEQHKHTQRRRNHFPEEKFFTPQPRHRAARIKAARAALRALKEFIKRFRRHGRKHARKSEKRASKRGHARFGSIAGTLPCHRSGSFCKKDKATRKISREGQVITS